MDETAYLTSTGANRAALSQSLKEAEGGRTVEVERGYHCDAERASSAATLAPGSGGRDVGWSAFLGRYS
jgi:hypothetical protein